MHFVVCGGVGEPPNQHVDDLVQEIRNSTADALKLRISCTKPSMCLATNATIHIVYT